MKDAGYNDESSEWFDEGMGIAFGKRKNDINVLIRSKFSGKDADLEKPDFPDGHLILVMQSPRGFGGNKIKLREFIDKRGGDRQFSTDTGRLIKIANTVMDDAAKL